ncbi:MAG: substrate-binding domain-containing protein [Clostridiales Family XIII bacterium]|nr:substrate-binding domain-containing protein [Clostridiales Family XIII bacterium]
MKKRSTLLIVALIAVLVMAMFAGCSSGGSAEEQEPAASTEAEESTPEESPAADTEASGDDTITIGFTIPSMVTEFFINLQNGTKDAAEAAGYEIIALDAGADPAKQASQVDEFIAQGVDAVILTPADGEAMGPSVEKVQEAGIPMLEVCTSTTVEPDSLVMADDVEAGAAITKGLCDAIGGKGNIVVIEGVMGQSSQIDRKDGMDAVLKDYPDVKILAQDTANWDRAEAQTLMENWIQAHGDQINGILCQNDEMAIGVANALDAADLSGKIPLVGIDFVPDSEQYIADGKITLDLWQDAYTEGKMIVETLTKILNGEQVEKVTLLQMTPITKDNVDEYKEQN